MTTAEMTVANLLVFAAHLMTPEQRAARAADLLEEAREVAGAIVGCMALNRSGQEHYSVKSFQRMRKEYRQLVRRAAVLLQQAA